MSHLFTSESVCAGHPDKVCDQISDAVLDAVLASDPNGKAAIECLVTEERLVIAGETSTTAKIDLEKIARSEIRRLGYTIPELRFTDKSEVTLLVHEQSPEINVGVTGKKKGAGDQGMMFGYATKETPELMPLPITLAHAIARRIDEARETGLLPYLRPDGKSQVTVRYEDDKPVGIERVVFAAPHDPKASFDQVSEDAFTQIVTPVLAAYGYSITRDQLTVNGTGVWHFSGPAADTGLTGRKIIVDSYGGYARVGGGAFSGKDVTKVDRSGAYGARYVAKNIVAAGLAERVEVALAYCIGLPDPVMKNIETFGTASASDKDILAFADSLLDCSVSGIIEGLNLRRPIYRQVAAYGHFGRAGVPWEAIASN